jgi:hypothetical protein
LGEKEIGRKGDWEKGRLGEREIVKDVNSEVIK